MRHFTPFTSGIPNDEYTYKVYARVARPYARKYERDLVRATLEVEIEYLDGSLDESDYVEVDIIGTLDIDGCWAWACDVDALCRAAREAVNRRRRRRGTMPYLEELVEEAVATALDECHTYGRVIAAAMVARGVDLTDTTRAHRARCLHHRWEIRTAMSPGGHPRIVSLREID